MERIHVYMGSVQKGSRYIDLAERTFGSLVVLERVKSERNAGRWLCRCSCGEKKVVAAGDLLRGFVGSCGCKQGRVTHGLSRQNGKKTLLYRVWVSMRQRCENPSSQSYERYGARGITVCAEWQDFVAFKLWADANGYAQGLTIERVDNDGGYNPSNCTWIPLAEQIHNRCNSRRVTFNGITHTVGVWARQYGLDRKTVGDRIDRGWGIEKALTTPVRRT